MNSHVDSATSDANINNNSHSVTVISTQKANKVLWMGFMTVKSLP